MMALTVLQPWASLIMIGCKPYEFRGRPLRVAEGKRWAVAAGKRPMPERDVDVLIRDLERGTDHDTDHGMDRKAALDLLYAVTTRMRDLPLGCVLGSVLGGRPVPASTVFPGGDPDIWANPVSDPIALDEPIPARGKQGWWAFEPPPDVADRLLGRVAR